MTNFLPNNYEVPKSPSNYFKTQKGQNKIRIISSAITGYVYWNTSNKPVRLKEVPPAQPEDIRVNEQGIADTIKHFWAFPVWDYSDNKIKIFEVTQKGIQNEIKALVDNAEWGDPTKYDINITRTGEKLETKHTVMPSPHKELSAEARGARDSVKINLNALYEGLDPFSDETTQSTDNKTQDELEKMEQAPPVEVVSAIEGNNPPEGSPKHPKAESNEINPDDIPF